MSNRPHTHTRLHLVRHGEVEADWRGRLYGCHDVELSERGRREARAAAERLRSLELAAVISSGLRRAEFGAACIREARPCARRDDADLRELERGAWVGLRPEETPDNGWRTWWAAPDVVRPPGGENLVDLAGRVLPRLEGYADEFPAAEVAIVAHSWVLRVAACYALSVPLVRAVQLRIPTGSILVIDWPNPDRRGRRHPVLCALGAETLPLPASPWFRGPRPKAEPEE